MDITLKEDEYLALVSLTRDHLRDDTNKTISLEEMLKNIESRNGVKRHILVVRWEELGGPVPVTTGDFADSYPASLEGRIELFERGVAKADVVAYVAAKAKRAGQIYVTKDPAGRVGWARLEQAFP